MLELTPDWINNYPNAAIGLLVLDNVCNPPAAPALEKAKQALEQVIRVRYQGFDRAQLRALLTLAAYHAYYKRFKKSYHVQLQLESVALKGKPIPKGAPLVETMFMAELDDLLLTAGHDLDFVQPPLSVDVANGEEQFVDIGGREQTLKSGDMFIRDGQGIISSIIYGPDQRTRIRPETRRVVYTTYAPAGIERDAVVAHLEHITTYVRLFAPGAQTEQLAVFAAN